MLFLDELPEFQRQVLEVLRQPLEEGAVTIARAALHASRYPARFMLVAAMNPCPCGYARRSGARVHLRAAGGRSATSREISGPLLDRIDLHVEVPAVPVRRAAGPAPASRSAGRARPRRRGPGACRPNASPGERRRTQRRR